MPNANPVFIRLRVYLAMCSILSFMPFRSNAENGSRPSGGIRAEVAGFISAHLHVTRARAAAGALGDHLSYLRDRR